MCRPVAVFALLLGLTAPAPAQVVLGSLSLPLTKLTTPNFIPNAAALDAAGKYVVGGAQGPGTYLVGGFGAQSGASAAYTEVTPQAGGPPTQSGLNLLPSLTGYTYPSGYPTLQGGVYDVAALPTGDVLFAGRSNIWRGIACTGGECASNGVGTTWTRSAPTPAAVLPPAGAATSESPLWRVSRTGVGIGYDGGFQGFVASPGQPAAYLTGTPPSLTFALAISGDGSVIGGNHGATGAAYWTRQADGSYQKFTPDMSPNALGPDGYIRGADGHWLAGNYPSGPYSSVGVIWDSRDGSVVRDLYDLDADVDDFYTHVALTRAGHVAVFRTGLDTYLALEGRPDLVSLRGLLAGSGITPSETLYVYDTFTSPDGSVLGMLVHVSSPNILLRGEYLVSWEVAPVPEPGFVGLAAALLAVGGWAARRAASRP